MEEGEVRNYLNYEFLIPNISHNRKEINFQEHKDLFYEEEKEIPRKIFKSESDYEMDLYRKKKNLNCKIWS